MKHFVIENLSNEDYHNSGKYKQFWSSSNLKYYRVSPLKAKYEKFEAEHKQTDAMLFGTQLHDYMACQNNHYTGKKFPEIWNVIEPPRKKDGSEYANYKLSAPYKELMENTKNPIDANDYEKIQDIYNMICNSDYLHIFETELLRNAIPELSVFIEIGQHKYKVRFDLTTDMPFMQYPQGAIFDYKTITQAYWSAESMNGQIRKLGYDVSAAMYQWGEFIRTGIWKPFYIIWILKDKPYDILISDISEYCYTPIENGKDKIPNAGALLFERLKEQHETCQIANKWGGIATRFDNGIANFVPSAYYSGEYDMFDVE